MTTGQKVVAMLMVAVLAGSTAYLLRPISAQVGFVVEDCGSTFEVNSASEDEANLQKLQAAATTAEDAAFNKSLRVALAACRSEAAERKEQVLPIVGVSLSLGSLCLVVLGIRGRNARDRALPAEDDRVDR